MKFHWKPVAVLALFLPLFRKLNYLFGAWQYSPLDQQDFIFWLLALAAAGLFLGWEYRRPEKKTASAPDYYGFIMLAAAVALLAASALKHINTAWLAGSLLFIAGGCWIIWGWRVVWYLFPAFFIAALGLPSTTYWTSFLFRNCLGNVSGLTIKLFFAASALAWLALCLRYPKKIFIRPEPFFFRAGLAAFAVSYVQTAEPPPRGVPLHLALKPAASGWLGETVRLSPLDASIKGKNVIRRYVYYSAANTRIGILFVQLRNDLHEIHPAALCLATARWKICSTTRKLLKTRFGILSVTEIVAEKQKRRILFFSWYSSEYFSTGSFISFRKSWHFNETWCIYQLATPIVTTVSDAECTLLDFLKTFGTLVLNDAMIDHRFKPD
ncbi:MAG: hypothetical protein PHH77_12100 [Victivallaceae bacterium]|nr:hypothetical protein [Victivallaceae bacterium]